MLFYCAYTWHAQTTREQVLDRMAQLQAQGITPALEQMRGWYALAGGGAGFVLIETDDVRQLTQLFQPYMDLMSWDVRAIAPVDTDALQAAIQERSRAGG